MGYKSQGIITTKRCRYSAPRFSTRTFSCWRSGDAHPLPNHPHPTPDTHTYTHEHTLHVCEFECACEGNRPTRNREKATTNQSRLQWKFYTSPKMYHIITKTVRYGLVWVIKKIVLHVLWSQKTIIPENKKNFCLESTNLLYELKKSIFFMTLLQNKMF